MAYNVVEFTEAVSREIGLSTEEAYMAGVLDLLDKKSGPLKRMTAARIIHRALLYLGEKDTYEYQPALMLKDIYDCHTCVIHIAQVYMKGIMTPVSKEIFGVSNDVEKEEAALIIRRIKDSSLRANFSKL